MVSGRSPAPASASQARRSRIRLTLSNWRTLPQLCPRRKVPRVDGAFTLKLSTFAVSPEPSTAASLMQSPPISAEAARVMYLSPTLARPAFCAQVKTLAWQRSPSDPGDLAGVMGQQQSGVGHYVRCSSKAIADAVVVYRIA